jgi:hypothetical protein
MADVPWQADDIVLPAALGRDGIWAHLQTIFPLPDLSQFQVISGRNEIPHAPTWPIGLIKLIPKLFPVTWRIEWPSDPAGYIEETQQGMTAMMDVEEAWSRLHSQVPRLFERATLDYRGKLRPGQVVQAEVVREHITPSVRFEVKDHGYITFTQQTISNMSPRSGIHAHFVKAGARIPPFACYKHEETRPYYLETITTFHLWKDIEIPNLSSNEGGAAEGDNGRGSVLPPIIYPTAQLTSHMARFLATSEVRLGHRMTAGQTMRTAV